MTDVLELAKYLLCLDKEKACADGEAASDVTPLKLQKLLYYCQGYSLGLYGEPLFGDAIEAWDHGPVIPGVYRLYKEFGGGHIPFETGEEPDVDERAKKIARLVLEDKGKFAPWALRDMTHSEKPWAHTYRSAGRNAQIPQSLIRDFFLSRFEEELSPEEEKALFSRSGPVPAAEEWGKINEYVRAL
ncbi:MAG: DUF4065 domain-containing protein [Synergistaceae bacterium]|jgi:uncharacterized phage-associated protein|nr:DUF4065 domain-containing protein [Synergistaceae bacterium]